MSKRIQDNEDMNYVQPAFKVASELKEAWDGIQKNIEITNSKIKNRKTPPKVIL